MSEPYQPRNHGRMLPPWLDTTDPHAQVGTTYVQAVDRELLVGVDRRRGAYTIWGPSFSAGGWVHLLDVQDDRGTLLLPPAIHWGRVAAAIERARTTDQVADIQAHNEHLRRSRQAEQQDYQRETALYVAAAVGAEARGASRFPTADVLTGLRNAGEGRSKREPVGRVIFTP